jgi:hypothetical protein
VRASFTEDQDARFGRDSACFPSRPEFKGKRCSKAVEPNTLAVSHDYIDMCISEEQLE